MCTGGVEVRVARTRYVDHGRHIELDHLFIEGIPVTIRQGWRGPVAAGWIRIEVAAYEPEFRHAAVEFRDRVRDGHARRLGKLAYTDKILGIQVRHALNKIVAGASPALRHRFVADMVRHGGCARGENRDVCASLPLQLQLVGLDSLADLVIADSRRTRRRQYRVLDARHLLIAERLVGGRGSRVMAVAIDDQHRSPPPASLGHRWLGT